jgi:hypothetical protein
MSDRLSERPGRLAMRYASLALVTLVTGLIIFGFSHTFERELIRPARPQPLILYVHVALAGGWLVLLVIQAWLATSGSLRLHRALGVFGAVVGGLFSLVAFFTAIELRKLDTVGDPIANLAYLGIPLGAWVMFTVPFALAVLWRMRPDRHRPLILIAACGVLAPALGRIPEVRHVGLFLAGLIPDILVMIAMTQDRLRRGHWNPTYMVALPLMVIVQAVAVYLELAQPPTWITIVRGLLAAL